MLLYIHLLNACSKYSYLINFSIILFINYMLSYIVSLSCLSFCFYQGHGNISLRLRMCHNHETPFGQVHEILVHFPFASSKGSGPEVKKLFPCSTQLSTKFILLISAKMPTIVGILTFISTINMTSERLEARNFFICRF